MRILSLFDGMACGMLAFRHADVPVDRYVAYEIDKYAIQVSKHNFPMIEQRGDVFKADFTEFEGFDFVIGGSPCTYWSIAQTKIRETEAHGIGWELFQQYVRAIKEARPKFFIYENNKSIANAIKEEISNTFGFEPIMIDSALVSAQRRRRYYWVGVRQEDGTYRKANIIQPEDRGILLRDVLDDRCVSDLPVEVRGMSYPLKDITGGDSGVIATLDMPGSHDILTRVFGTEGKSPTITAGMGGNKEPKVFSDTQKVKSTTKTPAYTVEGGQIEIKGKRYPIKLPDGDYIIRKLTVSEYRRLQTVPEWYDMSVISNSQAYKCLGNGWTVDVITHLIESVMNESCTDQRENCIGFMRQRE